jgi:N6-adenosine-specific RNA methylase IME4
MAPARKSARAVVPPRRPAGERERVLALYDAAVAALDKAVKIDEVKKIRNTAEQIQLYARQAQDTELMAKAATFRLRATRELGKLLIAAKAKGELAKGRPRKSVGAGDTFPKPPQLTLTVVGLTRDVAAEAQKLAKLNDRTFGQLAAETREKFMAQGARLVNPQSDVLVRQRKAERQAEVVRLSENPMLLPEGPFCGAVADPPWIDDDNPMGFNPRHYLFKYPTMNVEQICAIKCPQTGRTVKDIFGPHAAILLWCTPYHVAIGSHVKVLEAWGFRSCTEIVWDKELRGLGRGFSVNKHESLFLGLRGDVPAPTDENRALSLFSQRRSRIHSQKPDWPQRYIEILLPRGSYVDLFPGAQRKGWCPWGYQAKDDAKRHESKEGNDGAQAEKPAAQAARSAQ